MNEEPSPALYPSPVSSCYLDINSSNNPLSLAFLLSVSEVRPTPEVAPILIVDSLATLFLNSQCIRLTDQTVYAIHFTKRAICL